MSLLLTKANSHKTNVIIYIHSSSAVLLYLLRPNHPNPLSIDHLFTLILNNDRQYSMAPFVPDKRQPCPEKTKKLRHTHTLYSSIFNPVRHVRGEQCTLLCCCVLCRYNKQNWSTFTYGCVYGDPGAKQVREVFGQ